MGVGTGESLNEVPASGLPWPEPKERTARLKEALTLIRQLWSEERVSFQGQYYRTDKATIYDKPAVAPPIYVAAAGPVFAKYAGQFADGFICTSGKAPELYRETLLPNVAAGRQASGRKPEDIDMMIEMKVSFDSDRARAMEDTRHWAALALSAEEKISVEDPLEMERLADQLTGGARRPALDRVDGSGRACGEDSTVPRHGLPAPRVSRAGPRSGAVPRFVRRSGPAPAACGVWLNASRPRR